MIQTDSAVQRGRLLTVNMQGILASVLMWRIAAEPLSRKPKSDFMAQLSIQTRANEDSPLIIHGEISALNMLFGKGFPLC